MNVLIKTESRNGEHEITIQTNVNEILKSKEFEDKLIDGCIQSLLSVARFDSLSFSVQNKAIEIAAKRYLDENYAKIIAKFDIDTIARLVALGTANGLQKDVGR